LLAATGLGLIVGEPKRALPNPAFQIKMLMLAVTLDSGARVSNIAAKEPRFWEGHSRGRKLTGGFAVIVFFLWCAIAVAGRWIAYVHNSLIGQLQ
jgi:hypothetical protein